MLQTGSRTADVKHATTGTERQWCDHVVEYVYSLLQPQASSSWRLNALYIYQWQTCKKLRISRIASQSTYSTSTDSVQYSWEIACSVHACYNLYESYRFVSVLLDLTCIFRFIKLIIKPPLATVHLSVCLSPKCKNSIFSKTKQFRAMVSIDDL